MVSFFKRNKATPAEEVAVQDNEVNANNTAVLPPIESDKLITLSVVACGAGLFSDGYINNVRIGFV